MKTIGFCNQKGGVGKTTLAKILASYLAYEQGKKVAFIDADDPQFSAHMYRMHELSGLGDSAEEEKYYPITACEIINVHLLLEKLQKEGYEFVIVDLPGSASNENMISAVTDLDIIFIPCQTEHKSAEASYRFGALLTENYLFNPNYKISKAYYIWSMFSNTESRKMYDILRTQLFPANPWIPFLEEKFTYSVAYKSSDLCSTVGPIRKERLRNSSLNIYKLLEEIYNIITQTTQTTNNNTTDGRKNE